MTREEWWKLKTGDFVVGKTGEIYRVVSHEDQSNPNYIP
jgi:hypothetical protein